MEHNSILDVVQEYQDIVKSLRLSDVRSTKVPCSVVDAALRIARLHPIVEFYGRLCAVKLLAEDKKIEAIKQYKNTVCVHLRDAKDIIDEIEVKVNSPAHHGLTGD